MATLLASSVPSPRACRRPKHMVQYGCNTEIWPCAHQVLGSQDCGSAFQPSATRLKSRTLRNLPNKSYAICLVWRSSPPDQRMPHTLTTPCRSQALLGLWSFRLCTNMCTGWHLPSQQPVAIAEGYRSADAGTRQSQIRGTRPGQEYSARQVPWQLTTPWPTSRVLGNSTEETGAEHQGAIECFLTRATFRPTT